MAIWGGQAPTVDALIAKGKHDQAIALLEEQRNKAPKNVRVRLQLCDVLVTAKRPKQAVPILLSLVDELAEDGFLPKAIAVLKRVQRIDPLQGGVEERLADFCKDATGEAAARRTGVLPTVQRSPEVHEPNEVIETIPDMDLEVTPTPPDQSPLFSDFSRDELVEVIRGLELLSFEPGDIVMSEGEPGESLLVISSGSVKAFVKNAEGKNSQVREMKAGEFFGEISLLSGKPRTATVTASSPCDMLELDRATLDDIAKRYPHVRKVVQEFYDRRSGSESEVQARSS